MEPSTHSQTQRIRSHTKLLQTSTKTSAHDAQLSNKTRDAKKRRRPTHQQRNTQDAPSHATERES
jgi:hypothetical protein